MEFEEARKELLEELEKGASLDAIRKKIVKRDDYVTTKTRSRSTNFMPTKQDYPSPITTVTGRHAIDNSNPKCSKKALFT